MTQRLQWGRLVAAIAVFGAVLSGNRPAVADPIARSIATTMKYRAEVTALPAAT